MEEIPLESPSLSKGFKPYSRGSARTIIKRVLPPLAPTIALLLLCLVLGTPMILVILPSLPGVGKPGTCVDGDFKTTNIDHPFQVRSVFAVSLGFGSFEFAVARLIDITFDLVVGRGGQAFLAYLTYPIFTKVLLCSMETRSASYGYFSAIAFDPVSLSAMSHMSKDMSRRNKGKRDVKHVFVCLGLLVACLYVLAFPTLASAATGYSASHEPRVNLRDNSTAALESLVECEFVIKDGDRLKGGVKDQCITSNDSKIDAVRNYTYMIDIGVLNKTNSSQLNDTKLPAPPLNISATPVFAFEGQFYNTTYLQDNGYCRPVENHYEWGFSYLLLFITAVLTYTWAVILVALQVYVDKKGRLTRARSGLGLYRAVLDLSWAIRGELGEESQFLPNETLEKRLAEAKEGMRYQVMRPAEREAVPNMVAGSTPLMRSARRLSIE